MPVAIRIFTNRLPPKFTIAPLYITGLITLALFIALASPLNSVAIKRIASSLEKRVPRVSLDDGTPIAGMIILGGQKTRVQEALKLAKEFPGAPMILSGPETDELAIATELLPKTTNLIVEHRSQNTYENAMYSRAFAKPATGPCWLLITSATHMPRALGAFQAAGVPVAPWPVFDTPTMIDGLAPRVRKELMGLLGYWAVGRTQEIYPAYRKSSCRPSKDNAYQTASK